MRVPRCSECGHAFVETAALAEADGDPFLGKTVAGRYVILGRLGAGSMGTVYKARQEAMGRDVAVKILRSERLRDTYAKARFVREARAMSLLVSPHTVTVFDFGEISVSDGSLISRSTGSSPPPPSLDAEIDEIEDDARSLFLAMEMLEGESLGQRLRRSPRLEIDRSLRIARQALLSLAEAHDKGVIHRDLKPDNLFLVKEAGGGGELCKVLDFGIAKVVSDRSRLADALETQAGTVFGTPRYMSPEQAQGRNLDARSDLYTLGVLLYQMVVGRPPFIDEDAVVVMAHHIKSTPAVPSVAAPEARIPKPVSDLIMRALSKDPKERPPNARAFIAELDRALELLQHAPPVTDPSPGAPPLPSASQRPTPLPTASQRATPTPVPSAPQRPTPLPTASQRATPMSLPDPSQRATPTSVPSQRDAPPTLPSRSSLRSTPPRPQPRPKTSSSPPPTPQGSKRSPLPPSASSSPSSPPNSPRGAPSSPAREVEITRDGLEPNSVSSPPPSARALGMKPVLIVAAALAVGILGGSLAFGLLYPSKGAVIALSSSAARGIAPRLRDAAKELDRGLSIPPRGER